jgi:hypothetical protein
LLSFFSIPILCVSRVDGLFISLLAVFLLMAFYAVSLLFAVSAAPDTLTHLTLPSPFPAISLHRASKPF